MLDYLYLGLYRFFSFLLKLLPYLIVKKLMYGLSWFAYIISKKRRNIIHANLDLAFKNGLSKEEKRKIGIHSFMNLIDTIFGLMRRNSMKKEEVLKNVTFENEEIVKAYQKEGKKLIFISGHYGNWELMSQSIALRFDITFVGVGRKLNSSIMEEVLNESRERFNMEMIYKQGALKGSMKALSQNKAVGILVDQSIKKKQSIDVDFFGEKATHTPMASILSRKFGIDLIPVFISTKDYKNYTLKFYTPIKTIKTDNQEDDLAKLTQAQADIMERVIREHPKQWFWMHKRWKNLNSKIYNTKVVSEKTK